MATTYDMSDKKQEKLDKVKKYLDSKGLFYDEKANGQLQFDKSISLWATTEKWYDSSTGTTGVGINSFIRYLDSVNIL